MHAGYAFLLILGLAAGFVVAGLTTEVFEQGDEHGPLLGHAARAFLKAFTTGAATATALWAARSAHRRGHVSAWFLAPLGASVPAWYAFYEADHAEGLAGLTVTCALAWSGLRMGPPLRTGLLTAQAVAGFVIATGAFWEATGSAPSPDAVAMTLLVATSTIACTVAAARGPASRGVVAAALVTLGLAFLVAGLRDVLDGGGLARGPVVALTVLTMVALTWAHRRAGEGTLPVPG